MTIRIYDENVDIKHVGLLENRIGFGVILTYRDKPCKTCVSIFKHDIEDDDIPVNLQWKGYKFRIPATKINDTEVEFRFTNAVMIGYD